MGLQAALFLALTSADYCQGVQNSIMEGGEICGRSQMVRPLAFVFAPLSEHPPSPDFTCSRVVR